MTKTSQKGMTGSEQEARPTGRKFIGGHSNAKVGFDKSKAKCYKCLNFGHFARECQKDRAPASAQQDDSFDWGVHLEDAIIAQTQVGLMAELMELMEAEKKEAEEKEAEEKEASVAD
ncbi:hypothetical protein L1987_24151 [Smallanthus sonchifolius]|uniref:Uncharacterized protein n=1 Tax=Smallanthus sonchifolius TaxID=185202 RepID=A0ACB9IL01_9ASTR|nr:hypothetical protein L1987_24151 [Smallanthus sonchifolius]